MLWRSDLMNYHIQSCHCSHLGQLHQNMLAKFKSLAPKILHMQFELNWHFSFRHEVFRDFTMSWRQSQKRVPIILKNSNDLVPGMYNVKLRHNRHHGLEKMPFIGFTKYSNDEHLACWFPISIFENCLHLRGHFWQRLCVVLWKGKVKARQWIYVKMTV